MAALDDCVSELQALSAAISMNAADPTTVDLAAKLKVEVEKLAGLVSGGNQANTSYPTDEGPST
jgi:hypothetical protein